MDAAFTGEGKTGEFPDLLIPKMFDGKAGRVDGVIAFVPIGRPRIRDGLVVDAELEGRAVRLRLSIPADYDADIRPFITAVETRL